MSILAVCPFCKQGKVRAPVTAVGLSATCPSCQNFFTIVESKESGSTNKSAKQSVAIAAKPPSAPAKTVSDQTPLPTGITTEEPIGIVMSPAPLPAKPEDRKSVV